MSGHYMNGRYVCAFLCFPCTEAIITLISVCRFQSRGQTDMVNACFKVSNNLLECVHLLSNQTKRSVIQKYLHYKKQGMSMLYFHVNVGKLREHSTKDLFK